MLAHISYCSALYRAAFIPPMFAGFKGEELVEGLFVLAQSAALLAP